MGKGVDPTFLPSKKKPLMNPFQKKNQLQNMKYFFWMVRFSVAKLIFLGVSPLKHIYKT